MLSRFIQSEIEGNYVPLFRVLRYALDTGGLTFHSATKPQFDADFEALINLFLPHINSYGQNASRHNKYSGSQDFWSVFDAFCIENAKRIMARSARHFEGEQSGYVYLLSNSIHEYKLGKAKDPIGRRKGITKGASPLFVLHIIATDHMPTLENELHTKFSTTRFHGEWFKLSNEDVAIIRSIKSKAYRQNERVHLFSCTQIIESARSLNTETANLEYFRRGWAAGSQDAEMGVKFGYKCPELEPSCCSGYTNGYYVGVGQLELNEILLWAKIPECPSEE
jgi:hypothetical protein